MQNGVYPAAVALSSRRAGAYKRAQLRGYRRKRHSTARGAQGCRMHADMTGTSPQKRFYAPRTLTRAVIYVKIT